MQILFLGRANGARSQMAEALARHMFSEDVGVASAGLEPGGVHPLAVEALKELNIDLGPQKSKAITELDLASFDLVVVVCEQDVSKTLALPSKARRIHWPLPDPRVPPANDGELRKRFRDLRLALEKHLKQIGKLKPAPRH